MYSSLFYTIHFVSEDETQESHPAHLACIFCVSECVCERRYLVCACVCVWVEGKKRKWKSKSRRRQTYWYALGYYCLIAPPCACFFSIFDASGVHAELTHFFFLWAHYGGGSEQRRIKETDKWAGWMGAGTRIRRCKTSFAIQGLNLEHSVKGNWTEKKRAE